MHSPDAMAENVIQSWTERFPLVLEDLRTLPQDEVIIAEGPGLFPECVYPYLAGQQQAMWLVPTDAVCRGCRTSRLLSSYSQTSDPAQALQKLIERGMLLAAYVKHKAAELNLRCFEVDGSLLVAEVGAIVEAHFMYVLKTPNCSLDKPGSA